MKVHADVTQVVELVDLNGAADEAVASGSRPQQAQQADESAKPPSIGAYLARQRRLRGIELAKLSELTRIPLRSLERLEAGLFDDDPDGFVRGFVRTVADALGLDTEDALVRMLAEPDVESSSDEISHRRGSLLGLAALLVIVLAVIATGRLIAGLEFAPPASGQSERVYRRDAVRALAELSAAEEHSHREFVETFAPLSQIWPRELLAERSIGTAQGP